MATKREKQLAILLLKERIERQTGKKVVLKEKTENTILTLDLSAKLFCKEVLKLGSKENIFDEYMKKHNIPAEELSTFMQKVVENIQKNYIM